MIELNGIRFRNRLATSASLVGYGAPPAGARLVPYGMSPIAQFLDLSRFGAVTTRTITLEPREGHFTARTDWRARDWPSLIRRYGTALTRVDAGWLNAFGWANVGLDTYLRDYFPRTRELNRIVSVGGLTTPDFLAIVERVSALIEPGEIAAVELNLSCHNVAADFDAIAHEVMEGALRASRHPLIVKLSPDSDYVAAARAAQELGIAALTAINTVKGLRLDPRSGEPLLRNRYGGLSGRAIKPIGLRVVSELREAGIELPIVATGGIRDFDDAREYLHAGADVVSIGSEAFLSPWLGYVAAPLSAARIASLRRRLEAYEPPPARRAARVRAPGGVAGAR